jgi:hypothetical protein
MQRLLKLSEYSFLLTLITLLIFVQSYQPPLSQTIFQDILAISPSFVRQEINDTSNDWQLWNQSSSSNTFPVNTHNGHLINVKEVKDVSECKVNGTDEFFSPDIDSISYISNGTILNATVWLTSPFEEPHLNDSLDIYQEKLKVTISNTNLNLDSYTNRNIANMRRLLPDFSIDEENSTTLANNSAHIVNYTFAIGENEKRQNMRLWTVKDNKVYDITYSALPSSYYEYLPQIKKMINLFEIETLNGNNKFGKNISNVVIDGGADFKLYEGEGVRIPYPVNWQKEEYNEGKIRTIIFSSPFEDEGLNEPSWHETTYTLAVDIDSVHDVVTDYRIKVSRNPNNTWTEYWTRQVQEVSANDKTIVLEQQNNYTGFFDKEGSYVLFSFDLDRANYPQTYKVVFYITDYFVKNHRFCRLIDTTNWVIIPPPEFVMSENPSSLVLRPGEEKNVQLQLKGSTDLQSEAVLTINKNADSIEQAQIDNKEVSDFFTDALSIYWLPKEIPNLIVTYLLAAMDDSEQKRSIFSELKNETKHLADLAINFIPNKTSIPPSGMGTSTLHLKVSENATAKPYTIPINATISFPPVITNRGGEIFSNNKSVSVVESSDLTLTVLPPYSPGEHLKNFSDTWITPISGIWTFLAGVGVVIAPLVIQIYRRKQKKKEAQ